MKRGFSFAGLLTAAVLAFRVFAGDTDQVNTDATRFDLDHCFFFDHCPYDNTLEECYRCSTPGLPGEAAANDQAGWDLTTINCGWMKLGTCSVADGSRQCVIFNQQYCICLENLQFWRQGTPKPGAPGGSGGPG